MIRLLFLLCIVVFSASCSTTLKLRHSFPETKPDVIEISADIFKYWDNKFETRSNHFKNLNRKAIFFFTKDMQCKRGNTKGKLHIVSEGSRVGGWGAIGIAAHIIAKNANNPHRLKIGIIDLPAGGARSLRLTCKFSQKVTEGDFTLSIAKIYQNPQAKDVTTGKIIARNIVWTVKPRS